MENNHGLGITLALCAGAMAALASISAKLAMTGEMLHDFCVSLVTADANETMTVCEWLPYLMRGTCFAGIFLFNTLMWTFYTKSLQFCSSTIEATITNTGSNFLITAIVSFTLFGEQLSVMWWIGSCFILAGILLINKGNQEDDKKKSD